MARRAYRLAIAGLPTEFVSDPAMEVTADDGRVRKRGLSIGDSVIEQAPVVTEGMVEAEPVRVTIADDDFTQNASALFAKQPETTTWLTTTVTPAATTMRVLNTAGFTGATVAYVGTETIGIGGIAGTTAFTSVSRGRWGTNALAHYAPDGEARRYTPVDTHPVTMRGRRASLYMYLRGQHSLKDTSPAAGKLIFRGIVSSDAEYAAGGYSFSIAPMTRIFDQPFGAGLDDPVTPRGIHYHEGCKWHIRIDLLDNNEVLGTAGSDLTATVDVPDAFGVASKQWESQEEWASDVNEKIKEAITAITANPPTLKILTYGADGYTFAYEPNGSSLRAARVDVHGPIDGKIVTPHWTTTPGESSGDILRMLAGNVYYPSPGSFTNEGMIGARTVPRGLLGYDQDSLGTGEGGRTVTPDADDVNQRIYLGGGAPVSDSIGAVQIDWPEQGAGSSRVGELSYRVQAVDAAARSIEVTTGLRTDRRWGRGALPDIQLQRAYWDAANVGDFIDEITDDAPTEVNLAAGPALFNGDVDQTEIDDVIGRVASRRELAQRQYVLQKEEKLGDILSQEFLIAGVFPYVTDSGKLSVREFTVQPATAPGVTTISSYHVRWDEDRPRWKKHARGLLNTVTLKTGYDPSEDEYNGTTFKVQSIRAISRDPTGETVKVEPLSQERHPDAVSHEQAAELFAPLLGLYGSPYVVVSLSARVDDFSPYLPGDHVVLTVPNLPNWDTGKRGKRGVGGIQKQPGTILSTRWTPSRKHVQLEIFVTGIDIAGYAPSAGITSRTDQGSDTWDLGVRMGDPLGLTSWSDAGTAEDFYGTDDKIQIVEWNSSATSSDATGTVVSATGNAVRVRLKSTWTPGGDLFVLRFRDFSAPLTDAQRAYAFWASVAGRIGSGSDERDAREYAP